MEESTNQIIKFIKTLDLIFTDTYLKMKKEKHVESINEVLDEIESALKDPRGLSIHQRRIAVMTSIGVADLIELYLHKLDVIKVGAKIQHQWFQRTPNAIKEIISKQIVSPIENIEDINLLIHEANKLEKNRNDLAYGSPIGDEKILLNQINEFLKFKKIIESKTKEEIKNE